MCGISGIFFTKGKQGESKEAVERMNQFQGQRGPDDEGIFTDARKGVFLGHRRLAILDLSKAGRQPMCYKRQASSVKQQDLCISYNGEIYNFLELKKDLEKKGYKFKTKTDTEVILVLYAEYGEKSFSMLRGMFALGLWDGKNQKIFLVKDRYGVKPLYYYGDNEKLVFASTVKAITESRLVSVQKNPDAFIGFLLFGSVPLPMTTVKNVLAVPAGHYLVREADGRQKLVQYYEPMEFFNIMTSDVINIDNNFGTSDIQKIVSRTRALLEDSLRCHLISDAPLGVFLSGGLDSSALAALAAKSLENRRLKTLSIVFDEKEFSEEHYSDLVAKKIGSEHRKIKITKQDFFNSFDEVFEAMDQPTIDGVNTFFIAKAAKEAGLKTVLSGLGSDEIFCGYSSFKKAELLRKIQNLPKFLKPSLDLMSLVGGRYQKLNYLKNNDILSFYLAIRGLFMPQEAAKILNVNLNEVSNFLSQILITQLSNYPVAKLCPVDLLSGLELKFYLQNQLLKDTDFMSMRHSVEVRVPFLDHRLVEYASGLSPELKLNKAINKPLLVEATRGLLPEEIFNRKKMGFTFPFQEWMKNHPITQLPDYQVAKSHWSRYWAKLVLTKF
ncbi:MAG: asparagine synthase (glutamine-hydrolyzing) [Patescibacteria group bacterium]